MPERTPRHVQEPEVSLVHPDRRERMRPSGNVLIFKGQGFVQPGIGHDLWLASDDVKKLYAVADRILKRPISTISFEDPSGNLLQTQNAQPATVTYNEARRLEGIKSGDTNFTGPIIFAAGNSLGEYNALIASGAFTFEETLELIRLRAQYMQEAQNENPGTLFMPRLSKKPEERVKQLQVVSEYSEKSGIKLCLINTHNQFVYGGTYADIDAAEEVLGNEGIKFTRLNTDGAFHHPVYMREAAEKLAPAIDRANIQDARIPIIANASAKPVQKASEIKELLKQQMITPVRWLESMEFLIEHGFDAKIEIGEKPTFLNMLKDHPVFVSAGIGAATAITVGGVVIGHKLDHPHGKNK